MVIRGRSESRTRGASAISSCMSSTMCPTILEVTGIPAPEVVDGIKQKPIEGTSLRLHLRRGERQGTVQAHHPVFRDDGPVGDVSRRVAHEHQSQSRAVGRLWRGQPGPAEQPGVPALRSEHGLEPDQRHRRGSSREGQGNASDVPGRGQEISSPSTERFGRRPGRRRASEPHGRSQHAGLHSAHDRAAAGGCAVPTRYLLHDHCGHHRS